MMRLFSNEKVVNFWLNTGNHRNPKVQMLQPPTLHQNIFLEKKMHEKNPLVTCEDIAIPNRWLLTEKYITYFIIAKTDRSYFL